MLTIKEILEATGGTILQGNPTDILKGVSIDSRTIKPRELYIAIKGEKYDGHDFIKDVLKRSAGAILVSHKKAYPQTKTCIILVSDTIKALGHLARFHRDQFKIPVIAITGSSGKTTTKEMVSDVLSQKFSVLKNIATQNNHIGVPMTLLQLNKSHDVAVVELGTNHFGEIRWLAQIAHPTIAIITNIGDSHLEFLKSRQGVFKEKSSLLKYLKKGGAVILNRDDPFLNKIKRSARVKHIIDFSVESKSHFQATDIQSQNELQLTFRLKSHDRYILKTPAQHHIYNALAAISCGRWLGVPVKDIAKALKRFQFPKGRMDIKKIGTLTIIDDTYNANPLSLGSAIKTLSQFQECGRKVLICADMLELGAQSKRLHRMVGRQIANSSIDIVLTVGKRAQTIHKEIKKSSNTKITSHYNTVKDVCRSIKKFIRPGDVILVKGSRGMMMEQVVEHLKTDKNKFK